MILQRACAWQFSTWKLEELGWEGLKGGQTSSIVPGIPVNLVDPFVALKMGNEKVFELSAVDCLEPEVFQVGSQEVLKGCFANQLQNS